MRTSGKDDEFLIDKKCENSETTGKYRHDDPQSEICWIGLYQVKDDVIESEGKDNSHPRAQHKHPYFREIRRHVASKETADSGQYHDISQKTVRNTPIEDNRHLNKQQNHKHSSGAYKNDRSSIDIDSKHHEQDSQYLTSYHEAKFLSGEVVEYDRVLDMRAASLSIDVGWTGLAFEIKLNGIAEIQGVGYEVLSFDCLIGNTDAWLKICCTDQRHIELLVSRATLISNHN